MVVKYPFMTNNSQDTRCNLVWELNRFLNTKPKNKSDFLLSPSNSKSQAMQVRFTEQRGNEEALLPVGTFSQEELMS